MIGEAFDAFSVRMLVLQDGCDIPEHHTFEFRNPLDLRFQIHRTVASFLRTSKTIPLTLMFLSVPASLRVHNIDMGISRTSPGFLTTALFAAQGRVIGCPSQWER